MKHSNTPKPKETTLNTRIKHSLNRLGHGWPLLALWLCLVAGAPTRLLAQGTAFTYQGRLNDNGGLANGTYDLQFTVFDSDGGPNLVAGPLTNAASAVSNGEFLVTLDFGGGVFTGPARWLEIAVRTNGNGAFGTLSPRQPILPVPQAIYAANAGSATTAAVAASANSVSAANLIGTVADSQLSSNIARLTIPNTTTQATGGVVVTSGFATSAYVTNGGSGYILPPTVTVVDVSGSNAVITAAVSNGAVVSLTVSIAGSHYSTNATLTIAPPPSNAYQTFTSGNVFSGVSTFTSANNTFAGSFTGNGAGLTNVNLTGPSALSALGNAADGYQALAADTTGTNNTAHGYQALSHNTSGYLNTADGYQALFSNTTGNRNVAIGDHALYSNTTGPGNTAVGSSAMFHNTSGVNNMAYGIEALFANTTGWNNTALGGSALRANTTGNNNTAVGWQALWSNTTGGGNTASGFNSLLSNQTGSGNTADGINALANNTSGGSNTAVGQGALAGNTTASRNTAVGYQALNANTTGSNNVASGYQALFSNTSGNYNTASGIQALYYNTTGTGNAANGLQALFFNTTGLYNTANGQAALQDNTTGSLNVANGLQALFANTNGSFNVADGAGALWSSTSGSENIAVGHQAGYNITTGSSNIDIGNLGLATDTNIIRIGSGQTQAFIAGVITGNGGGLTNLNANFITGGLSTNIAVLVPGGGSSTLYFTNGVLRAIQ
jgi:hypothetical protein